MYEYLDGRLDAAVPTRIALDVGGVGYDVAVPLGARFAASPASTTKSAKADGPVRVWTHHVVREDAQRLFGFPTREEREVFRLLLSVRGVGPGVALAILSSLPGEEFLAAVTSGDRTALTRVKGVGKKTAEQILLDLADKAVSAGGAHGTLVPKAAPGTSTRTEDAVRALISIGYSEKEARKSVERASERVETDDLEVLVRTALSE